jgi:membrane protein
LAFLYIAATLVVLCAEINVVRVERLYPRALLTPFTDNVDLTDGDRSTYTAKAEAERTKGFEKVEVTFGVPPHRSVMDSIDSSKPEAHRMEPEDRSNEMGG